MRSLKEARDLAKLSGPMMYHGSALTVLQKLVSLTYSPTVDDAEREISVRASTIMKCVNVKERQFRDILEKLRDVAEFTRERGNVTYKLNLEPLTRVEMKADSSAASRVYRTDWARIKRAEKRSQMNNAIANLIASAVWTGCIPTAVFEPTSPSAATA